MFGIPRHLKGLTKKLYNKATDLSYFSLKRERCNARENSMRVITIQEIDTGLLEAYHSWNLRYLVLVTRCNSKVSGLIAP